MAKLVETLVGAILYYSGLVRLARFLTRRAGPRLIILCYHRATGGDLRSQLRYLKRHYRILHLEAALEELYGSTKGVSQKKDRRTMLVAAFDDGYRDNYTDALALARELQIPFTVFLVPHIIESGQPMSWLAGEDDHLLSFARVDEATIDGYTYLLNDSQERQKLARVLDKRMRFPTSIADREEFLASVRQKLGVPATLTEGEKRDLALTWSEVEEMEKSEWVSFGAHTVHHPMLTCLTDPREVEYEIRESRVALEQKLGHPVRTFAYPYGDFGERELQATRASQCDWAVTTLHGINTSQTDPHLLYRIVVGPHQHWLVLAAKVSGVWEVFLRPFLALAQGARRLVGRKQATR